MLMEAIRVRMQAAKAAFRAFRAKGSRARLSDEEQLRLSMFRALHRTQEGKAFETWLEDLKDQDLEVYDGAADVLELRMVQGARERTRQILNELRGADRRLAHHAEEVSGGRSNER